MSNLPEIISNFQHPVFDAIREVQQPRSQFQLERFVVGQHDTFEMQYYQCLLEIQSLVSAYRVSQLEARKTEIEISKLLTTGDEIDAINAEIKSINLEQVRNGQLGTERELTILLAIWESFPVKYTRKQIEDAQADYWAKRLTRQAHAQAMGSGRVDWAQIDALAQAGVLEEFMENFSQKEQNSIDPKESKD